MSLYTFSIWPDQAIVSADTRQCVVIDGVPYRKNDVSFKLHVVGDRIVTFAGESWLGTYVMQRWAADEDTTVERLQTITLEAIRDMDKIGAIIDPTGQLASKTRDNRFCLEILVLEYDKSAGHNVLWQLASYNDFELRRNDVTSRIICYGGIHTEIMQEHMHSCKLDTIERFLSALFEGYEKAASEEVGGFLSLAMQDMNGVNCNPLWVKIPDSRKIRNCADDDVASLAGSCILGQQLIMENPQFDGNDNPTGVMQFKVDATGAWLNNSTFVLQKDGGGKILLDPNYGIVAGTGDLFDVNGTTVFPSFIDENKKFILDQSGMPKNANFFLDLQDGNAYFRGKVYATGGEFDGIVKARDFQLPSGDSMVSALNDKGKINSDWLDLMGINVKNGSGDTVLTIDESGLRFGNSYSPIVSQFSMSLSGPWSNAMSVNDKYRRDSLDGGTTWGEPYQFRGTDGQNGSDASVPDYITSTKITETTIESPTITGGVIRGGRVESDSVIDVKTDAQIGNKLVINASNFNGGIEFRYSDGTKIGEVYVDPVTKALFIEASGGVYVNGQDSAKPTAVFA